MMHMLNVFLAFSLTVGCSISKPDEVRTIEDTLTVHRDTLSNRRVVKPNRTLIGAIILAIDTTDQPNYTVDIELRTAIPDRESDSLVEPGQRLRVVPSYKTDDRGVVDGNDERNRRLMEVRSRKVGDFLFGKITMSRDSTWYLIDTELR
jgi:hypothetical protein